MLFFHVDDLILVGPGNDFEKAFDKRFSNSSCHEPNTILGMKFEKENHKIMLSLPKHIQHGLEELGLTDCKTSTTPMTPNIKLVDATDDDHARFKRLNINYRKPDELLQIFSDASWGDDPQDRTSQSGYLCFLFGTLISWNSSKQRCITYSSTEAELNPLVDAFHEGIWLKALLAEIWNIQLDAANHLIDDEDLNERLMMSDEDFKLKSSNQHLIDNKGLDDKVKKFGSNPKTRHIDLKTKGIRQEVKYNNIRIKLISTTDMTADALTKSASKSSIRNLVNCIDPTFNFIQSHSHQPPGV
ncbi:hypothetical protein VP01_878g2 [Puccinia sorghi]|uniref:Reverse transcriptase Ty1/copia-type domain-containing protein n=1 Tax=Puccinia sorghi TaxID=27349 RepID=A0A0L6U8H6_9BASI|nr:hypothetical protein VP01_878g2 [Puccinia sorghi]